MGGQYLSSRPYRMNFSTFLGIRDFKSSCCQSCLQRSLLIFVCSRSLSQTKKYFSWSGLLGAPVILRQFFCWSQTISELEIGWKPMEQLNACIIRFGSTSKPKAGFTPSFYQSISETNPLWQLWRAARRYRGIPRADITFGLRG